MKINDYKIGDSVEVLINNPRLDNKNEWRKAEVIGKRIIYPSNYSHHKPFPILIVRVIRTYCKSTPIIKWIENIPVYVDSKLYFYEKENDEGILYMENIKLSI